MKNNLNKLKKLTFSLLAVLLVMNSTPLGIHALAETVPSLTKVTDYLYETVFEDYDYAKGAEYLLKYKPDIGGCSSVQYGALRGRNYDWYYDESIECVVHVPAAQDRHASIGIAAVSRITDAMAQSGEYDPEVYELIPFTTLDGINDAGLCININVVNYGEKGSYTMKTETTEDDVCCLMIPRLILDCASTVDEAIYLLSQVDLFSLSTLDEAHYMISGSKSKEKPERITVVVEFIPDAEGHYQLSIIGTEEQPFVDNKMIMTNFHLTGFDGTPESLTAHPMGWERYKLLAKCYEMGKTEMGMADLMKKVYSTRCYDLFIDDFWYSEYAYDDLTMDKVGKTCLGGDTSLAGAFEGIINYGQRNYNRGERDSSYWQTVHCSVYNLDTQTLTVRVQEGSIGYKFTLAD